MTTRYQSLESETDSSVSEDVSEYECSDETSSLSSCLLRTTKTKSLNDALAKHIEDRSITQKRKRLTSIDSSIEKAVRKVYHTVKKESDLKKERLVRSVLDENLYRFTSYRTGNKRLSITNDVEEGRLKLNDESDSVLGFARCSKRKLFNVNDESVEKVVFTARKKRTQNFDFLQRSASIPTIEEGSDIDVNCKVKANGHEFDHSIKYQAKVTDRREKKSNSIKLKSSIQTLVFPRLPSNRSCFNPNSALPYSSPCTEIVDKETKKDIFSDFFAPSSINESFKMESNDCTESDLSYITSNYTKPYNLVSTNEEQFSTLKMQKSGTSSTNIGNEGIFYPPLMIEGTHPPYPTSSSVVFLKSYFAAADENKLANVPYFGDDDSIDITKELIDVGGQLQKYEYGPPYLEKDVISIIDRVLKRLAKTHFLTDIESSFVTNKGDPYFQSKVKRIYSVLAELMGVSKEAIKKRHQICFTQKKHERIMNTNKTPTKSESHSSSSRTHKKQSGRIDQDSYKDAINSYRDLFCRVCFRYDCNIHGNIPKASLQLLGELAIEKEKSGYWTEFNGSFIANEEISKNLTQQVQINLVTTNHSSCGKLTPIQQSICEHAYTIFQGNMSSIAHAMGVTPQAVGEFVTSKKLIIHPPKFVKSFTTCKKREKSDTYHSMRNYNPKWLNCIQSKEIHPEFIPCNHDEPCNESTCSCIQNAFFCTKHCVWGSKSRNFFRGCGCKAGQCRTSSCPCWAAGRECDPDLCRSCGACTDPPNQLASRQKCQNDNLSMRRHAHLLLAESSVKNAGWGIYTKYSLKKGDFIHEYVGEVISQEEAERRGIIYDKLNMSYLFNLSSDCVVDATRKGNKIRYMNHSSTPNCEPKMIRVNGDIRIGLFAIEEIDAQSELFFDYRYDDHMDNDLIFKAAHKPEWMRNPNSRGKVAKKNALRA